MAELQEELKREDKITAEWLLFYSERKKEYKDRHKEILYSSNPTISDGMPKAEHNTSDPTSKKAITLVDELAEMGKWIEVIEKVRDGIHPKLQIFLRLRQEYRHARGRKGWVAPVQWRYAEEVAKMLNKDPRDTWIESRKTFTRWWDNLVKTTARQAAKKGLLK